MNKNELILLALAALGIVAVASSEPKQEPVCPDGKCPIEQVEPKQKPLPKVVPVELVIPPSLREENWTRTGSCMFAAIVMNLRGQHRYVEAASVRRNFWGSGTPQGAIAAYESVGAPYAYTVDGDVSFLEWAARTRRYAGITWNGNHFVNLVYLDNKVAGILDNNFPDEITFYPRAEFINNWQSSDGWAFTAVYDPPPPIPHTGV